MPRRKQKDKLLLVLNYIHNPHACYKPGHEGAYSISPRILLIEWSGFYRKKIEKIEKLLDGDSKAEILQIISFTALNLMELKKIIGYSYSTIHEHIHALKKLKIIRLIEGKSKKGKREMKIGLNENVRIIPLSKKEEKVRKIFEQEIEDSENSQREFQIWLKDKIREIMKKPTLKSSTRKKK